MAFSIGNFMIELNHQFLIGIDYTSCQPNHGSIGINLGPVIISYHWVTKD